MEVAAVAWTEITPLAQARSGALLKLNPLYGSWIDNVPEGDRDRIAFIKASKWADVIKRFSPYQPDGLPGSMATASCGSQVFAEHRLRRPSSA
jgi:hypothetical protein